MKQQIWKTLAITFILLCIIETGIIMWWWNWGKEYEEKENECIINICDVPNSNEAYFYDAYEEICYCYKNNELTYQKYVG